MAKCNQLTRLPFKGLTVTTMTGDGDGTSGSNWIYTDCHVRLALWPVPRRDKAPPRPVSDPPIHNPGTVTTKCVYSHVAAL